MRRGIGIARGAQDRGRWLTCSDSGPTAAPLLQLFAVSAYAFNLNGCHVQDFPTGITAQSTTIGTSDWTPCQWAEQLSRGKAEVCRCILRSPKSTLGAISVVTGYNDK